MGLLQPVATSLRQVVGKSLRAQRDLRRSREYRKIYGRHDLLRPTPSADFPLEARRFWERHYGRAGDPIWHRIFANFTGKEDVRFVPHDIFFDEMLPYFNKMPMRDGYLDKNLPSLLLGGPESPITSVRRIHDRYYDGNYRRISRNEALASILAGGERQVIKPALTDNGIGITMLNVSGDKIFHNGRQVTLDELEESHGGDFIVQSWIHQHPVMAEPHPSSVNTIRLVTFRWDDEIRVLLAFARFGSDGKVTDNARTGGVCCGIDSDGRLAATSFDRDGGRHTTHPTTGYDFTRQQSIPNYAQLCQRAMELHDRIWHFDLVSWDWAIRDDGQPIFVEFNVRGTAYTYQFALGGPMFADQTVEVLERIRDCGGQRSPGRFRPL